MWFVTWDRPEYKEWAKVVDGGYLLVILRTEENGKLYCVRARLNMGPKGLPGFVVDEDKYPASAEDAQGTIDAWKS